MMIKEWGYTGWQIIILLDEEKVEEEEVSWYILGYLVEIYKKKSQHNGIIELDE